MQNKNSIQLKNNLIIKNYSFYFEKTLYYKDLYVNILSVVINMINKLITKLKNKLINQEEDLLEEYKFSIEEIEDLHNQNKQKLDSIIELLPQLKSNIFNFEESKEIYDRDIVKLVNKLYDYIVRYDIERGWWYMEVNVTLKEIEDN